MHPFKTLTSGFLFTLLVVNGLLNGVKAQAVELVVQDQHGDPLANTVIEWHVEGGTAEANLPVAIMDQVDKAFSPEMLVIQQGQRVNFPNSDNIRHHVYSFSQAKTFELKLYSGQPKQPVKFNNSGIAVLGCNIHDSMVGYVYIANSPNYVVTDQQGRAQVNLPKGVNSMTAWHALNRTGPESRMTLSHNSIASSGNTPFSITLVTTKPAPRNTFQSKFRHDTQNKP